MFGFGDGLLLVSGEENQFIDVVLQAVFIEFQRFLASVSSSVVDSDSDRSGELNTESGGFDLSQSESYMRANVPLPSLFLWLYRMDEHLTAGLN